MAKRLISPRDYEIAELDWDDSYRMVGSAHSVSNDPAPEDRVDELRKTVEKITGKPLPPRKRKIGFT